MKIKKAYVLSVIILIFTFLLFIDSQSNTRESFLRESNLFVYVENNLQDIIFQKKKPTDTKIVLVAIDEESLQTLGRWPWPRSYHAELINIISEGDPAAIGVDVLFTEASDPEEDEPLIEAVENAGNVVLASYALFEQTGSKVRKSSDFVGGELLCDTLVKPFGKLSEVAATGHINVFSDVADGIVRKHLTKVKYQDGEDIKEEASFAINIYNQYLNYNGLNLLDESQLPVDKIYRTYIDFTNTPSEYTPIPYYEVLTGEIPPEYFKDCIVLIGPYSVGLSDQYYTAIDRQTPMYGIEIHANIMQSLMYKSFKKNAPITADILILFLLSMITYYSIKRLIPALSALATCITLALYIWVVGLVYSRGIILSVFYPIASAAVIYLVMLAYRYLEELMERKRITGIFGRYVAPQVVKEILTKGEAALQLGGTKREITALFVDIRGFTPMSEKVQPEEVVSILNEYLDLCASAIFENGGTLDKFIGDATMAIFNAPLDLEEHALKAVKTAWAMKQGSIPLQEKLTEKYGRSVQFGIGVNTGYAVVGNIGSKTRMDFTAIGDTVNTAARLESNAMPGQILISSVTYEIVRDKVIATPLGTIKVKGKEQELTIYQLDGIK